MIVSDLLIVRRYLNNMYTYAIILLYLYESLIDTIRESTSLQLRINVVVVNQASITSEFVNIVYSELKLTKTHKNLPAWALRFSLVYCVHTKY